MILDAFGFGFGDPAGDGGGVGPGVQGGAVLVQLAAAFSDLGVDLVLGWVWRGLDVEPGVYRTAGPARPGSTGYYALLSSTSSKDVIDNGNVGGPATVTVGPDVKAVSLSGWQPWHRLGADLDRRLHIPPYLDFLGTALEAAVKRLEEAGSPNVRNAARGLIGLGYVLVPPVSRTEGKRPANYLRITDPARPGSAVGYLTPQNISFTRDRARLVGEPEARVIQSTGEVAFSHAESATAGKVRAHAKGDPGATTHRF